MTRNRNENTNRIRNIINDTGDVTDYLLNLLEQLDNSEIPLPVARQKLMTIRELNHVKRVEIMGARAGKTVFDAVRVRPARQPAIDVTPKRNTDD